MKIVVTGGGSGGHITPILAVAHELKVLIPDCEVVYIGQRGDALSDIPAADPNIDIVYTVWAGKLRRYADENWLRRLTDFRTIALNVRDGFRLLAGMWQSYRLLGTIKPDIIFTRGGFVSVPVAVGGRLRRVPYITHDADSVPSLANRLIARHAAMHAVSLPVEIYPYPKHKTIQVGIPVAPEYVPVTASVLQHCRHELQIDDYKHIVLLTGGGNGSRPLNQALVANASYLLATYSDLAIIHITGRNLEAETNRAYDALQLGKARGRVITKGFVTDLYRYSAAADIVIARAGAVTLAELAIQAKACIIVPAPQLAGDHQTKNTRALSEHGAVVQMSEDQIEQPERLGRTIGQLLEHDAERASLGQRLASYAHPQAAAELAALIIQTAEQENHDRP